MNDNYVYMLKTCIIQDSIFSTLQASTWELVMYGEAGDGVGGELFYIILLKLRVQDWQTINYLLWAYFNFILYEYNRTKYSQSNFG